MPTYIILFFYAIACSIYDRDCLYVCIYCCVVHKTGNNSESILNFETKALKIKDITVDINYEV